ncbi:MAG: hypothetical protein SO188_09845 [Prevotella sp.]|nr:hypothetical protein [Prevotella sp.]
MTQPQMPVWLAIPVVGVLTYIVCLIVTKVLSLIPESKYVIG